MGIRRPLNLLPPPICSPAITPCIDVLTSPLSSKRSLQPTMRSCTMYRRSRNLCANCAREQRWRYLPGKILEMNKYLAVLSAQQMQLVDMMRSMSEQLRLIQSMSVQIQQADNPYPRSVHGLVDFIFFSL